MNYSLNSSDDGLAFLDNTFIKVAQIIMIPMTALAVIANTMAIFAIVFGVTSKRPIHRLLISISVSDSLASLAIVLVGRGYLVCEIASMFVAGGTAVELNLFFLALDQYVAVCHPFRHPAIFSPTRTNIALSYVWIASILSGLLYYLVSITSNDSSAHVICIGISQFERIWFFISTICIHLLVLPTFVFLYTKVFLAVRNIDKVPTQTRAPNIINKKGIMTTLIIASIFMMLHLPMSVLTGTVSLGIVDPSTGVKFVFGFFLSSIMNSIVDPFVYSLRFPDVREGYRRVCFPRYRTSIGPQSGGMSA